MMTDASHLPAIAGIRAVRNSLPLAPATPVLREPDSMNSPLHARLRVGRLERTKSTSAQQEVLVVVHQRRITGKRIG
jgi:hypothetical protein